MNTIRNALIIIDEYYISKHNRYMIYKRLKEWFNLTNKKGCVKRNIKIHIIRPYRYKRHTRSYHTKI